MSLLEITLDVERAKNARAWAKTLTNGTGMTSLEVALHASFLALRDIPAPLVEWVQRQGETP